MKVGSFDAPTFVTAPAGDRTRLFVVQRGGKIMVLAGGHVRSTPFLDLSSQVSTDGERGLLSMAFSPDYAASGRFYVFYTDSRGNIRVDEFRRSSDPNRADPASRRSVLTQAHSRFTNHNGGQLQFGPDGLLYIGVGDGGGEGDPSGNGQSLGTLDGKLLRIDPNASGGRSYTIPPGNPFAARNGARPEIYAYGLRNPWRFSFDRKTGDLTIGDVGQDKYEEVDFERRGQGRGRNFGWKRFEGFHRYSPGPAPNYAPPVLERAHSTGWCAIVGGYVVRDRSVPSLFGRYVYGDDCASGLRAARLAAGRATGDRALSLHVSGLDSFGEDALGRVYAVSLSGPMFRIAQH